MERNQRTSTSYFYCVKVTWLQSGILVCGRIPDFLYTSNKIYRDVLKEEIINEIWFFHFEKRNMEKMYKKREKSTYTHTHTHNMKMFDQWVAVWWPGFATLLPSNRKPSGSNFFLFLFTVWNLGLLLVLLFIIWVIFPDISFNKEISQVHPQGPSLP